MREYDFILAGGGLAGLSLAYRLAQSLPSTSMLVLDRDSKTRNDRTWCFWANQPTIFDGIVYRSWDRLAFKCATFERTLDLADYTYRMIRGIDFYRFVHTELSHRGNVDFVQGDVDRVESDADGASAILGNATYRGKWVFDSRFDSRRFEPRRAAHWLEQHFKGWVIETPVDAFEPQTPTLFDFRTEQKNDFRFFYVLPLSTRRALVEYVLLEPDHYDHALRTYLESVLGIREYRIMSREGGVNPLTDYAFPRRTDPCVMTIGTPGGRVKPTSGYAFLRIQKDSAAIVDSLIHNDRPFDVAPDSSYYRLCDSLMLELMHRRAGGMVPLFADLFQHNPIRRVLRFLDQTAAPWENVALMASLPPAPFMQALVRQLFDKEAVCPRIQPLS